MAKKKKNKNSKKAKEFNLPQHDLAEVNDQDLEEISSDFTIPQPPKMALPMEKTDLNFCRAMKVQTSFTQAGRKFTRMKAPKTAWVHNLIYLNGQKFDFTGREYLRPIYDGADKEVLLKTARQVEKSTFLSNNLTIMSSLIPFFKTLYVSPSHQQTRQFSNEKLKPILERSPLIARYLQDTRVSNQVFEKGFTNGSFIFLRSAFLSADRARGISSDLLCYDKDSYLLTREGWKLVSETTKEDILATRNPVSGKIEWHRPYRIVKKTHTGSMVTFSHMGFHMRVTGDHKMLVNWNVKEGKTYRQKDEWSEVTAEDLYHSKKMGFKLGIPVAWNVSNTPKYKVFDPWTKDQRSGNKIRTNHYPGLKIPYLKFAGIVGWYLAKGCLSGSGSSKRPVLNINKEKDLHRIESLLSDSNVTYTIQKHPTSDKGCTIWLNSSHLTRYFENQGNTYKKHIPREFMDHPEAIRVLLESIYRGDACYHSEEDWDEGTLRTRSKQLSQDVQEAWLRLGRMAVINTRMHWNKLKGSKDYDAGELLPMYEICAYKKDYMIFWKADRDKKTRIKMEHVTNEEVYCVTVKNHHLIVKGNYKSKPIVSVNCLDELQDLLITNVPVIAQCLSHSKYGYHLYAGTPKSFDNTIEIFWQTSTQSEWMVPCSHCSAATGKKWNFLDDKNIGKKGPICKYCGKPLFVTKGQWQISKYSRLKGYRIPQLMVPWIAGSEEQWDKLVYNYENYPESQFFNEVLGLSYDNASKPITRADVLMNCSEEYWLVDPENLNKRDQDLIRKMTLFAGVDWGEGNDGTGKDIMGKIKTASYTVLTIGGYVSTQKFRIVYMKRYEGRQIDPDFIVPDIVRICTKLRVRMIGSDWGHGWGVNNQLFRKFGVNKCAQFMYVDNQKEVRKWDPIGFKFQLLRNHVMSEVFLKFKEQGFIFAPLSKWEHFAKDMFNISVEYIEYQRKLRYVHRPSDPDDWFHSLVYCIQVASIYYGKKGL